MATPVEHLRKDKEAVMDRLKNQEKEIDHFTRARRLEEIPLLAKQCEEEKKEAKEIFEQQEAEEIEQLKNDWQMALTTRGRLKMIEAADKDEFLKMFQEQRKEEFKKSLADFENKISEERKRRLYERKEKRREERRQKWLQEKAEEKKRLRDEQLKRDLLSLVTE
uniref:Eukaryotic translation initiation factor 3 subunit A-like isoform X2 n=1 Tax=Crassostrea virginica TaxID=6565 RepID=A0A8B8EGG7_CRAVI|nr:eukaryotic translation initiation factor 3 subunit A-like isoform X2 [Crassostrea virginica]